MILFWKGSAFGVNAFISQDLPFLAELVANSITEVAQLTTLIENTRSMIDQGNEYVELGQAIYGGIEAFESLTWEELQGGIEKGLINSRAGVLYLSADKAYQRAQSFEDLDSLNPRSVATARGMLWEYAYGPAIEYMPMAKDNLEASSQLVDYTARKSELERRRRAELWALLKNCVGTGKGEGACLAAANRAELQSALLLSDLHSTSLLSLDLQRRSLNQKDRESLGKISEFERFTRDFDEQLAASFGLPKGERCAPGRCLYQRYSGSESRLRGLAREKGLVD